VTQEFFISVTPVRDGDYIVRTERVAMGVPLAEEMVSWSVDQWLSQSARVMHDPLLGLLRGHRSGTTVTANQPQAGELVALGQDLYNAIFQGTIRDSWMIAQGVAQNQKEILRLRLGLKDNRLPLLPWEVLHDGARPLGTNTDIVFSRYRSAFTSLPSPGILRRAQAGEAPLRILMVLAAPTDQERLQLHQEAEHLQAELQRELPGSVASNLELVILDQPGREQLTQALEQEHYDILHYAGHSDLSAAGGDLYLVNSKTGLTEVLSGDDLAGLLVNNGVRMAVFNSCQGVHTATTNEAGGNSGSLSDALLKRGVPAVLAMAERIPDEVALNLSRLFYRNLKQGCPIDLGLSRARQGLLSSYGSDQLYWALPILYLHSEFDGYLQVTGNLHGLPLMSADGDWQDNGLSDDLNDGLGDFDGHGFDDRYDQDGAASWDDLSYPEPEDLNGGDDAADRGIIQSLLKELQTSPSATNGFSGNGVGAVPVPPLPLNPGTRETDPRQADAADFSRLGQQLYAQGDWSGAIGAYGDALRLDPESAAVYNNLGEALEKYGSLPEALTAYKMALQLDPDMGVAQHNLERLVYGVLDPALTGTVGIDDEPGRSSQALANPVDQRLQSTSRSPSNSQNRVYGKPHGKSQSPPASPSRGRTIAVTAATFAVLGSIWFLATRPSSQGPGTVPLDQALVSSNSDNQNLVAISTQSFTQGDLPKGQQAVEQLLDRGALVEAEGALNTVPKSQLEVPTVSYLRGRLAWEFFKRQASTTTYRAEDARRFWAIAAKAQPTNIEYHNALGFGLYAEGRLKLANDAWFKAATLSAEQTPSNNSPELMTAYAGQALVLAKEANQDPKRLDKAIALRDRVLQSNPEAFQPNNLAKDWRWTQTMIADWKQLVAAKSSGAR
jgi:tetratricopeptide (TPR) repeat protein